MRPAGATHADFSHSLSACSAAVTCLASARLSPSPARLICWSRSMQASSVSVVTPEGRSATNFTRHTSHRLTLVS